MSQSSSDTIRAGVVGVGYYGSFHAEKYATLPGCSLAAIADHNQGNVDRVAAEHEVEAFPDHRDLIGRVDVASVAVPAKGHYEVARDLLEAGIHVLVEKPITRTVAEARELVELARKRDLILQVGHLERFNPAFAALPESLRSPAYIETHRLTKWQNRNADVSVVLDLMIHDIDLVHALMRSPVTRVEARGVSVFSDDLDMVNAMVRFENGGVANLTASRASLEPQRTFHLFQHNAHTWLDMHGKDLFIHYRKSEGAGSRTAVEEIRRENEDILRTEVAAFLDAVRSGQTPVVPGEDGLAALETALRINEAVEHVRAPMEPLEIFADGDSSLTARASVTHDPHPETRQTVFSRSSLVNPRATPCKE